MDNPTLRSLKRAGAGISIVAFPLLLPLGFVIQIIGLTKEKYIPKWQGITIIIGLLLLFNPDIEIISSVGAALMCVGLIPVGLRELQGTLDQRRNSSFPAA